MIVDTSAIVAILRKEAEARRCADLLTNADRPRLSAASCDRDRWEPRQRHQPATGVLVEEAELTIEPVTANQARIARRAYREFGRGSGHPARLNFGDCFAYALAKDTGEPLLFVGNDFTHTDVQVATDPHRE